MKLIRTRIARHCHAAILAFALFAFNAPAFSQSAPLPAPLRDVLLTTGVPPSAVGIYVHEVGATRPLLEHNAAKAMNPASTMKLLTTLAGLELLGPNFTWHTDAWLDGTLNGDVLQGNLVLKGYGDPKLTLEDFWLFLRDLRARGLREIRGDLVLDRTFFAGEPVDPAQFDNDPTRPYNVGPDPLLINYKSVRLQFLPQEDAGTVKILMSPDLPQISILNQLALGAGNCDFWPEKPQAIPEQARLIFSGVFPRGCGEKSKSFSLLTPNEYAFALFQQLWRELGGTITGRVRDGAVPDSARLLATWESEPLAAAIRDINKFSNNVMARQVFLTLALAVDNPPVSTDKATRALRDWLARSGLDFPELQLENGSGLSRNERISVRHLGELLLYAARSPFVAEYAASLPIPGVDGTLRRRLTDSPSAGRGHLKTGYLEGVRAIAGYMVDNRGRTVVLVSVINHPQAVAAQAFQEAVVQWVWSRGAEP
ncbi:MAG TPA: D-alanyl-D-alanine carboxypeptidase/D-alanyl-D-alanine-endopeptidase [Burkholderiales bacterium]|nr:D-alanyl-D-alanine carboxypeptidase/D-alanyl-D-alanine-endopeptidase [Burkholderiales bacterium]